MIAVDTNILVYAHRSDSPFHIAAAKAIRRLVEAHASWAIPWPCIHEFLSTVTHPRAYRPPTPFTGAASALDQLLGASNVTLLHETEGHWEVLRRIVSEAKIAGPAIHDARIAAICIGHGVQALWSADRDFHRFAGLKVVNPLTD